MGKAIKDAQSFILSRVQFDTNGGCWLWSGWHDRKNGYGRVFQNNREVKAHRASFAAFCGPVNDKWVLHKCDVRACVNPDHLYLGTRDENTEDMMRRGRACLTGAPKGEANSQSKLTDEMVSEIRLSPESSYALASRLPVTPSMVRRIRRGQAWKHVKTTARSAQNIPANGDSQ